MTGSLINRAAGYLSRALASLMTAQVPTVDGTRPRASGTNVHATGDDVSVVGAGSAVLYGEDITLDGAYSAAGGRGIDATAANWSDIAGDDILVARFDSYAALPGGAFVGGVQPGAALGLLAGDDRDGFSTVVCDDALGTNPQTIAPNVLLPSGKFAPPAGTTARVLAYPCEVSVVRGEQHHVLADGEALAAYYVERGLADLSAGNGIILANWLRLSRGSAVTGRRHQVSAQTSQVAGDRHTVSGGRHAVSGTEHTVSGIGNAVHGSGHQVHGHDAEIVGRHGVVDRTIGTRHLANGYFSTQGDVQRDEYLLIGVALDTTGWVELSAGTYPRNEIDARALGHFDRRLILRDGLARVRVEVTAATRDGAQRLVRTHDLAISVTAGVATILADPAETLARTGTVDSRVRVSGRAVYVEIAGATGAAVRGMAHVTVDRLRFEPAAARWPWQISRMRQWPTWAPPAATLFIDFANDRACWRATPDPEAVARYATVAEAMDAFGAGLAGATRDHLGLLIPDGATPTIDFEAGLAAGHDVGWENANGNGTASILFAYPEALPAADEVLLRVADSDGSPALAALFDVSEPNTASAEAITDGGTVIPGAADFTGTTPVGAVRSASLVWGPAGYGVVYAARAFAPFNAPAGVTYGDLSEIRLGHGAPGRMTGRIISAAYRPSQDPGGRLLIDMVSPRWGGTYA